MINEDRVKELYHLAAYESTNEKLHKEVNEYYLWDYVWKEVMKSFFSGSLAFVGLLILWVIQDVQGLLDSLNSIDLVGTAAIIAALYIAFMALYIFATVLVYVSRYGKGRKKLRRYVEHLKNTNRMYNREEKLRR